MKKVSTTAANEIRNFSWQKLTIGLDLGDHSSWYCVLDEGSELRLEQKVSTTAKGDAGGVRRNATQPDRAGDRDAFVCTTP